MVGLSAERMFKDEQGRHYVLFEELLSENLYCLGPFSAQSNRDLISAFLDQHGMMAMCCWDKGVVDGWGNRAIIFPADREDDAVLLYLAYA